MSLARLVAVGVFLSLPLTSCDGGQQRDGPVESGPAQERMALSSSAQGPGLPSAANGENPRRGKVVQAPRTTWRESLQRMTAHDRQFLESTNARYLGMLEATTPEEAARLRDLGFPTPEDWLKSRSMSDSDLKALADSGSHKAQMFYADRQLVQSLDVGAPGGSDSKIESAASQASAYSSVSLRYSKSPFAAYMFGVVNEAASGHPEAMAAAILAAGRLGDQERSKALAIQFATEHPELDLGLMSSYDHMITQMIEWKPR